MNEFPRYKGKVMTQKQFKRRMKQVESGKMRKKQKLQDDSEKNDSILEGRRIVELKVIAQHLYCTFCKEILSLEDTEEEIKKGLASLLKVKCRKCLTISVVPTSKTHTGDLNSNKQLLYDTNTKAVLGALHSGFGHTGVDKFLHVMNIPNMCNKTFKNYEREIGPIAENIAKESCAKACEEERKLTKSHLEELQKRL